MTRLLLTGLSGVGKTTVLTELGCRGHRVVETDLDGWTADVAGPGEEPDHRWDEERMSALLATTADAVVAGCVTNQGRFADRFDAVVLLSAPVEVMLARIAGRSGNPYGKDPVERDRILAQVHTVEPRLRGSATVEVRTDRPLAEVVAAVEAVLAGAPPSGTMGP